MFIDSHVHTHYSHGDSEVYRIIYEAIKKNMLGVGFCEHFHYDFFSDGDLPTVAGNVVQGTKFDNFKLYYKAVTQAKVDFSDQIKINLGVEVDYVQSRDQQIQDSLNVQPFKNDYKEKNSERKFEFDFIMGATHFIGDPLKYFSDYKEYGDDWLINEYFSSVESSIKSGLFDIIAHPELIKYFVKKEAREYQDRLETLVDLLSEYKVAIDLNTDYLIDPKSKKVELSRLNPGVEMLKLCKEKNIRMVLGSDAHTPIKLANNFAPAIELLKELGIQELHYFQNRKPITYNI